MKKVLAFLTAVAATATLALSASAVTVTNSGDPDANGAFTISIIADADGPIAGGAEIKVTGPVKFSSITRGAAGDIALENNGTIGVVAVDATKDGVLAILTFVTTGEGDYTVEIIGTEDDFEGVLSHSVSGTVGDSVAPPPAGDDDDDDDVIAPPPPVDNTTAAPSGGGDGNVPTGVAIAVIPAIVAGAAAVVSKKRK